MAPTLYMIKPSPPVRTILITAKALGLDLTLKELDFTKGEHLKPEYLKINPQHTVPTLVEDDGFILWDSHAIAAYLVSKYGKNDSLYPKDLKKRALVDQRLHFESGVAFAQGRRIIRSILRMGKKTIDQADKDELNEVYGFLEAFLEGQQWVAGDSVTIADYSLFTSTTSANVVVPVDAQKYPNITAWLKKVEQLPEAQANKEGLAVLATMIKSKLSS